MVVMYDNFMLATWDRYMAAYNHSNKCGKVSIYDSGMIAYVHINKYGIVATKVHSDKLA